MGICASSNDNSHPLATTHGASSSVLTLSPSTAVTAGSTTTTTHSNSASSGSIAVTVNVGPSGSNSASANHSNGHVHGQHHHHQHQVHLSLGKERKEKEKEKEMKAELNTAKVHSRALDAQLAREKVNESLTHKLLLLGTGESGKSTIFKQLITLYSRGFNEHERRTFIPIIHQSIVHAMRTLCQQSDHYDPISDPTLLVSKHFVLHSLTGNELLTTESVHHIIALWQSEPIQRTLTARNRFHLSDSAQYFFERIYDVVAENYLPSDTDVCRSHVRTTGIVEREFKIDANTFKVVDVGGQRNERKKWIHCFEHVSAVIFVAAISEYDQVLYEDESTNRLVESLTLFEDVVNAKWFTNSAFVLFLNKKDIFADKLKSVPLDNYFPDYRGGPSFASACAFLQKQFQRRCRDRERVIYTHVTCATDTNNVATVFMAVKDMCITLSLKGAGLV